MVGDINIFYHDEEDRTNAEIDVMIAEKDARGKGLGLERSDLFFTLVFFFSFF